MRKRRRGAADRHPTVRPGGWRGVVRVLAWTSVGLIVLTAGTCVTLLVAFDFDWDWNIPDAEGMAIPDCAAPRLLAALDRDALVDAVAVDTSYGIATAVDSAGTRTPLFGQPFYFRAARWSPNGQWLVLDFDPGARLIGYDAQRSGAGRVEYALKDPNVECTTWDDDTFDDDRGEHLLGWSGTTLAIHTPSATGVYWPAPQLGGVSVGDREVVYSDGAPLHASLAALPNWLIGQPLRAELKRGWAVPEVVNQPGVHRISLAATNGESLFAVAPVWGAPAGSLSGVVVRSRPGGPVEVLGPWNGTDAVGLRADPARHRVVGVERWYDVCVPRNDTPFVLDTVSGAVTRYPVAPASEPGGVAFATIAVAPDGSLIVGRQEIGAAGDRDFNGCPLKPPGWAETFRVSASGELVRVTDLSASEKLALDGELRPPR